MQKQPYFPTDYDVDYADTVTFGQLSTAQQRVVLFIRALIHKPDIIILDEALSSMPASTRDKCITFLETGEVIPQHLIPPPNTRRPKNEQPPIKGFNSDPTTIRHTGISQNQALIMISHVKEEIPDTIRHYMRLPSDPGDGAEPLDFRLGVLENDWVMSDSPMWERVWSPASEFEKPFKAVKIRSVEPEEKGRKQRRSKAEMVAERADEEVKEKPVEEQAEPEEPEVKPTRRGRKKAEEQTDEPEQKPTRGRKKKVEEEPEKVPRRGRKKKVEEQPEEPEQKVSRRGRPKKTETKEPKGRGRPKKAD